MVATVDAFIQLPLDTSNTGKKRRTKTRVVGANTVHEDVVIVKSDRDVIGAYITSIAPVVIPATLQNGTTAGLAFFYNPIGGVNKIAVEKIRLNVQFNALAVDLLAGNLALGKFTFTGTGSGAVNTNIPTDSRFVAATANSRQAMTGLTISLLGNLANWFLPVMGLATGGAGVFNAQQIDWVLNNEEEEIILLAGEGLVIYSAATLTTSNRLLTGSIHYEEFL